ncbi:MAG: hypothetical protein M8350_05535 [Methanosarcinaceae archaeon]|nr:hypothetical protein [Methanosarcinaceae archaeon]
MVDTSKWVRRDKYRKFANNWKLIGVSSKIDFKEQRLTEDIMNKLLPLIRDSFGDEGLSVIKKAFFLVGVEKGQEILGLLGDTNDVLSCIMPLETVCMLVGIESNLVKEEGKVTLHVFGCPFETTLQDSIPKNILCECYSQGLVHAANPDLSLKQPCKSCMGDDHCEFVIES